MACIRRFGIALVCIAVPLAVLVFVAARSQSRALNPGEAIATVNGIDIPLSRFSKAMADAAGTRAAVDFATTRDQVLRDLIDSEIVYQTYAHSYGTENDRRATMRRFLDEEVYPHVYETAKEPDDVRVRRREEIETARAIYESKLAVLRGQATVAIHQERLP